MARDVKAEAHAFAQRYGALFDSFSTLTPDQVPASASEVASFYRPDVTFFTNGRTTSFRSREDAVEVFEKEQRKAIELGLGTHLVLDKVELAAYSDTSCLCHLTWTLHPGAKCTLVAARGGWTFTNVYGYRAATSDGVGAGWEFVLRDQEVNEMKKAVGTAFD